MTTLAQQKSPQQQLGSVYHFSLIKILVVHQLGLQGITWDDFISRDFFRVLERVSEVRHEGEPSQQYEHHEIRPISITYQRGTRPLFAAAKRVLSPPSVEGGSLPTSAPQVQEKGKNPKRKERPSGEPSGFVIIHDDETASDSEEASYKRIIKEQETDIHTLQLQLEIAKWNIRYLEQ